MLNNSKDLPLGGCTAVDSKSYTHTHTRTLTQTFMLYAFTIMTRIFLKSRTQRPTQALIRGCGAHVREVIVCYNAYEWYPFFWYDSIFPARPQAIVWQVYRVPISLCTAIISINPVSVLVLLNSFPILNPPPTSQIYGSSVVSSLLLLVHFENITPTRMAPRWRVTVYGSEWGGPSYFIFSSDSFRHICSLSLVLWE